MSIALVVSSIANPFYPEFALEVERAARKLGYFLLVCNTNDDPQQERAYLDAVGGSLAQGVIVMNADSSSSTRCWTCEPGACPWCYACGSAAEPPQLPCIAVDFYQAGVLAAEHLLKLGHERIGVVVASDLNGNHRWRYLGFKQTLERAGVVLSDAQIHFGHDTIDDGRNAAHTLLAAVPDLSAIFVSNDLPALGVLQAAVELGLEVPQDLSVIGITDIQLAHQMRPALTTVAVPTAEAAALAVEMLMALITEPGDAPPPMRVCAAPRLVVRASTAKLGKTRRR